MITETPKPVEVTQADIDAARRFNKETRSWEALVLAHDRAARDTLELAEEFARHRLSTRPEAQSLPTVSEADGLADDVVRLVVAARDVAFGGLFDSDHPEKIAAIQELDQASEAFASRVPWENEDEA